MDVTVLWLICKCGAVHQVLHLLSWVGSSLSCPSEHGKDVVFTQAWFKPDTVDTTRNSLKPENFPILLGKLNKLLLSLNNIWSNHQSATCTGKKARDVTGGSISGKAELQLKCISWWWLCTLHNWQVPIGIFWKLVLSVVILYKGINRVCLSGFYMCFS